jgi:hypothetical protein
MMKCSRQGDICPVFGEYTDIDGNHWDGTIPSQAEVKEDGVIAEGEVTGHRHRISDVTKATLLMAGLVAYVKVLQETEIIHEEHDTVTLFPGDGRVVRQREYEPDGWRQVAD